MYRVQDKVLRVLVAEYLWDKTGRYVDPERIRWSVVQGYNGEMGGNPTPNIVTAILNEDVIDV